MKKSVQHSNSLVSIKLSATLMFRFSYDKFFAAVNDNVKVYSNSSSFSVERDVTKDLSII